MTDRQLQAWNRIPLDLGKRQEPRNFKRKAQNSENLSVGDGSVGAAVRAPIATRSGVTPPPQGPHEDSWRGPGHGACSSPSSRAGTRTFHVSASALLHTRKSTVMAQVPTTGLRTPQS